MFLRNVNVRELSYFCVYLIKHRDIQTCWEVEVEIHAFLISAVSGGECSDSGFTPGETALCSYWTGGWVGPRADLYAVEERKISCSARN
jgi:hypothetical protein